MLGEPHGSSIVCIFGSGLSEGLSRQILAKLINKIDRIITMNFF